MPIRWGGKRPNVELSASIFASAICVAVGVQLGFARAVAENGGLPGQRPTTLILGWVAWNLFPAILLAIGVLLRREGR
jgi:hypothetical protein